MKYLLFAIVLGIAVIMLVMPAQPVQSGPMPSPTGPFDPTLSVPTPELPPGGYPPAEYPPAGYPIAFDVTDKAGSVLVFLPFVAR